MDEDQLRELWNQSFDDLDSEDCDPMQTVKPAVRSETLDFRSTTAAQPTNNHRSIESSDFPVPRSSLTPQPQSTPEPSTEERPEPYSLEEEIGEGGNGVIYRARQRCLNRDVAIKMAKAEDPISYEKFTREAKITGRLDHPNIVPVYDLGLTAKGQILLAMKLVDGVSWLDLILPKTDAHKAKAKDFFLDDHIKILMGVCNALSFAHSKGIAHCDLKPENVMVGEFGEVLVMDWGIATNFEAKANKRQAQATKPKSLELNHEVTSPRGTPCYMPPEMAEGRGSEIGPKSDIYLLGATLYELLKGHPPHQGPSIFKILWAASQSHPPRFDDNDEIPEELKEICRKSMERDPENRYETVKDFRDALKAYLEHRESRQISGEGQKILRGCQRVMDRFENSQVAKLTPFERDKLYAKFADAVANFRQAAFLWVDNPDAISGERKARLIFARAALSAGDLGLAEAQIKALKKDPEALEIRAAITKVQEKRKKARRAFKAIRLALFALVFVVLGILIVGVLFARAKNQEVEAKNAALDSALQEVDERRLEAEKRLVAEQEAKESERQAKEKAKQALLTAKKNLARIYVEKSRLKLSLFEWLAQQAYLVKALSFDDQPSTRFDVFRSEPHPLRWLGRMRTTREKLGAAAFSFSEQKQLFLIKNEFGTLQSFRPTPHALKKGSLTLPEDAQSAGEFCLAPKHPFLAYSPKKGQLSIWDCEAQETLWSTKAHKGIIHKLRFSHDGQRLVSLGADRMVKFWSTRSGESLSEHKGPRRGLLVDLKFSRGDRWAASFSNNNSRISVFNGETGQFIVELNGHKYGIAGIDFHPSEKWLVSGATDKTLRIWDLEKSRSLKILRGHNLPLTDVKVSPDGRWIASASRDKTARLWNFESRRQIAVLSGHGAAVTTLAFSADSKRLASGSASGKVHFWSAPSGRPLVTVSGHRNSVRHLYFSKSNATFYSSDGQEIYVWSLLGPVSVSTMKLPKSPRFFAIHPRKNEVIYGRGNLWTRSNLETEHTQQYRADTDRDLEPPDYHPRLEQALFATDRGEVAWISSSNVVLQRRKTAFDMIVKLRVNPDESITIAGSQNRRPCVQFFKGQSLTPLARVPEGSWQGIRWARPNTAFGRLLNKEKTLYEIDMSTGMTKPFITLEEPLRFFDFNASFSAVAIQCEKASPLYFYDLKSEKLLVSLDCRGRAIDRTLWSPDGRRLIYLGREEKEDVLVLVDLTKNQEVASIPLKNIGAILHWRFSPDSRKLKLILKGRDLVFTVWDLPRLEAVFAASIEELSDASEQRSGMNVEAFQLIRKEK